MMKSALLASRMGCVSAICSSKPLISHEVIVNLIGNTTNRNGLHIPAEFDTASYPTGRKLTDEVLGQVHLTPDTFHGEWNYTIAPMCSC